MCAIACLNNFMRVMSLAPKKSIMLFRHMKHHASVFFYDKACYCLFSWKKIELYKGKKVIVKQS